MTDRVRANLLAVSVTTYSNLNLQLSGVLTLIKAILDLFHVEPTARIRLGPSNWA